MFRLFQMEIIIFILNAFIGGINWISIVNFVACWAVLAGNSIFIKHFFLARLYICAQYFFWSWGFLEHHRLDYEYCLEQGFLEDQCESDRGVIIHCLFCLCSLTFHTPSHSQVQKNHFSFPSQSHATKNVLREKKSQPQKKGVSSFFVVRKNACVIISLPYHELHIQFHALKRSFKAALGCEHFLSTKNFRVPFTCLAWKVNRKLQSLLVFVQTIKLKQF